MAASKDAWDVFAAKTSLTSAETSLSDKSDGATEGIMVEARSVVIDFCVKITDGFD